MSDSMWWVKYDVFASCTQSLIVWVAPCDWRSIVCVLRGEFFIGDEECVCGLLWHVENSVCEWVWVSVLGRGLCEWPPVISGTWGVWESHITMNELQFVFMYCFMVRGLWSLCGCVYVCTQIYFYNYCDQIYHGHQYDGNIVDIVKMCWKKKVLITKLISFQVLYWNPQRIISSTMHFLFA